MGLGPVKVGVTLSINAEFSGKTFSPSRRRRLAQPLAQSRILPKDFKQQPKRAEADDSADQHYRDFGLRLNLLRTLSRRYRGV